jgi:endoglucanase
MTPARRKLNRRQAVAALTGAVFAMPGVLRAAPLAKPLIKLKRGMNLWPWFALTREFPAPSIDYDWPPFQPGRAIPDVADLAALRSSGIDFVRLPVDPGPLLAFADEKREQLIGDVLDAVALALANDLSVVVNLHPNGATHHWTPERLVGSVAAPLFTQYLGLVRTMAARLRRFDPARVAFEPLNEPPQSCGSADWALMQGELIRTARTAAPELTLVATGACGSMIAGLELLDPARLGDANLVYTFHLYEPYVFSHQGAPWMSSEPMYQYLNAIPWPASAGTKPQTMAAIAARMAADTATPAARKSEITKTIERVVTEYFDARPDRRYIDGFINRVTAWADRHGVDRGQILLGEFGALRSDERYVASAAPDRARYIRDMRESCEAAGMSWAFWNFFDGMGLTADDVTRQFDPSVTAALGLRMPGHSRAKTRRQ